MTTIICTNNSVSQIWQLRVLLESFKEHNFNYPVHILVYMEPNQKFSHEWHQLDDYNCQIFQYGYTDQLVQDIQSYTNIHRVASLIEHYRRYPELEKEAIFYLDSDIMLTRPLEIEDLLQDDICYGSDINHYSNYTYYFETKQGQVKQELLQTYMEQDPIGDMIKECGLEPEVMKKYNLDTAGVHYLLKGFTKESWERIYKNTLYIHRQLDQINQTFIIGETYQEKDDKGFQKYCADILATHIEIWSSGKDTQIHKELNFIWPGQPIEEYQKYPWFHNAGVGPHEKDFFYKGKYVFNTIYPYHPIEAKYIDRLHQNKTRAQWHYIDKIVQIREKYYPTVIS